MYNLRGIEEPEQMCRHSRASPCSEMVVELGPRPAGRRSGSSTPARPTGMANTIITASDQYGPGEDRAHSRRVMPGARVFRDGDKGRPPRGERRHLGGMEELSLPNIGARLPGEIAAPTGACRQPAGCVRAEVENECTLQHQSGLNRYM